MAQQNPESGVKSTELCQNQNSGVMWREIKQKNEIFGRRGHTGVFYNHQIYIFSGFCDSKEEFLRDFHKFDVVLNVWKQLPPSPNMPPKGTWGHTASIYNDEMIIFGGLHYNEYTNECYSYNFITCQWRRIKCTGQAPKPRYCHSSVIYKDKMIIFAGYDSSGFLSDLYELHLSRQLPLWKRIDANGNIPSARADHTAVLWRDAMYVFGGFDGTHCNNELWKYDIKSERWTLLTTRGIAPLPRCYQSAVLYNDQMIIFGGECGYTNIDFNDCYKYDFLLDQWQEVKTSKPPLRRYRHIGVLSNNQMYIFGGRNIGMNIVLNDIHALCIGDPIVGTNL